ncbi:MAG: DUF115 domain-containing protein, partial [Treponema sp.]|nr:DUF115 domain-containing protein [Treponema sp.]
SDGVFVLASSSSLSALMAGGIRPDMVIATDGGGWALMHMYACFRQDAAAGSAFPPKQPVLPLKLACAFSAAIPSRCSESLILPISDGSLWQTLALNAAGVPSAIVPQRGTVTASALELALALGTGSVFLAGMDLCVGDIRSHARPYGFDHLFFGTASRLRPVYSQIFARSGEIRAGGSHDVYAAWFKSRLASWQGRVFALGGEHRIFGSGLSLGAAVSSAEGARRESQVLDHHFQAIPIEGLPMENCNRALEALIAALKDPNHATTLANELTPLLLPLHSSVEDLAEALRRQCPGECRG